MSQHQIMDITLSSKRKVELYNPLKWYMEKSHPACQVPPSPFTDEGTKILISENRDSGGFQSLSKSIHTLSSCLSHSI